MLWWCDDDDENDDDDGGVMMIAWPPCITGGPRGRSWPGVSEQLHPLHSHHWSTSNAKVYAAHYKCLKEIKRGTLFISSILASILYELCLILLRDDGGNGDGNDDDDGDGGIDDGGDGDDEGNEGTTLLPVPSFPLGLIRTNRANDASVLSTVSCAQLYPTVLHFSCLVHHKLGQQFTLLLYQLLLA